MASSSSSPRQDLHPLPLLQLHEVDSSKAPDRPVSSGLLSPTYSAPVAMDNHTVCIPSPYTDGSHEYTHGPLTFYSPSLLSYPRAPVPDSPPTLWPSSHGHAPLPSLTLPPPLPYSEPWLEAKGHGLSANRWVPSIRRKRACTQQLCTEACTLMLQIHSASSYCWGREGGGEGPPAGPAVRCWRPNWVTLI